jgi:hypothetical protein
MKKLYSFLFVLILPLLVTAQDVVVGTGTAISVFSPLNRTNDYCVYEVIYLQSQIGISGTISQIGFQRHDGTNVDSIENVSIFLKHTSQSQLLGGNYDTTGYTLVYFGSFPNDSGAGWRQVMLDTPFLYDGVNNLQVLVSKGYQAAIANTPVTPRWIYTNISPSPARARRYYDDFPITSSTPLTTTVYTSNAILTFGTTGIVEILPGQVSVFPNPTHDLVNFYIDAEQKNMELIVSNSLGQVVYRKTVTGQKTCSFSAAQNGSYYYLLTGNNNRVISSGRFTVLE